MSAISYIATWFYKESAKEASFYPQTGQRGDSELTHSIYMQIQVPFFVTFRHYNPESRLLFFTNAQALPEYLEALFGRLQVEVIRLPYRCLPPDGWYKAWRNQFYVYDILRYMEGRMAETDSLLVCDADCLCRRPLAPLFREVEAEGCALYEQATDPDEPLNGTNLRQMEELYAGCYGKKPSAPLSYYGGEFIALRGDAVAQVNKAYLPLWQYNLQRFREERPKLNEEALFFSVLAEHLHLRNNIGNRYVKRMWTTPRFNNVRPGDELLAVWHLPYEKKRGLYRLYKLLAKQPSITDEQAFWAKASRYTGVPCVTPGKRLYDRIATLYQKITAR